MKTCDFSNAKVGDKVWHFRYGWDRIGTINMESEYPIETSHNRYTLDGFIVTTDINPSLFWNEFEIPEVAFKKPLSDLKVDDKVIVWNKGCENYKL